MIVMKFGGSSLATKDKVLRCVDLVRQALHHHPLVVVSACGKTTDRLIRAAESALCGNVDGADVLAYHQDLVAELELDEGLLRPLFKELHDVLHGISLVKELTLRTKDLVMSFGERLSTQIVAAAMTKEGFRATAVNAYDLGLITTSTHGSAAPLEAAYERIAAEIERTHESGVRVITGFLGKDEEGNITTLGRSGSDYSASIVGAAVGAREVQIWTDVDGVMTCDPSLDKRAENLPSLSFDEASELAYFGAEVLHPATLVPVIRKKIPVQVLNTGRPQAPGTRITSTPAITKRLAKSVVYKEDVCLVHLASPRLTSAVDLLADTLAVMREHGVAIHMATTSEATVSLVTGNDYDERALEHALDDLARLGTVDIEKDKTIICVVGAELKGNAHVLGRIFGAVSDLGIKAKMVSQSASELNVAFLVDNAQRDRTVTALHELLLSTAGAKVATRTYGGYGTARASENALL